MPRLLFLTCFLISLCLISDPGVADAEALKVGVLNNFPPQYILDDEGQPDGLAVDLFEQIVTETDFEPRYRVYESWEALHEGLRKGEVDLSPSMGMADSRREWASFSEPLETFQISLFVRKGNSELRFPQDFKSHKLGIVHLNIGEKIAARHPGLQTQTYAHVFDAFHALLAAQVDGIVFPRPTFYKVALEAGLKNRIETAGEPLHEMKRGLGVAKGNESLLAVFNPIISRFVLTEEYRDIYARWYGAEASYWSARRVLIYAVPAIGLLVGVLLFWRYKSLKNLARGLKKDLEHKTHDLRNSEKKYRTLYENAPLPYQSLDEKGRLQDVNTAWLSTLGYARHEVIGQWFGDFLHPESRSFFETKFPELKKRGYTEKVEFHIRHREGYYLQISLNGCVGYSEEGVFERTYCVFHNITAQKESERILRQERNFTQSIIDTAQIIILVLDMEGRIQKFNPYIEHITGYAADEVLGLDWFSNFLPPKEQDAVKEVFEKGVQDIHIKEQVNTILTRKGDEIWVEWSNETLRNPDDGTTIGMLAIGQDITERIEAEQRQRELEIELRQKHKMEAVGLMAGGIAHNFNNSLASSICVTMPFMPWMRSGFWKLLQKRRR
ncbi:MAG: PAS domain S-box protein [Geobacteraceae bacterium]|nr:PAS domain S-box protein [Geobacteraceae bacterium]